MKRIRKTIQIVFFIVNGLLFFSGCTPKSSMTHRGSLGVTVSGAGTNTARSGTQTGTSTNGSNGTSSSTTNTNTNTVSNGSHTGTGTGTSTDGNGGGTDNNNAIDYNLYRRNIAAQFPLPADQDPLQFNAWSAAAVKTCDVRANRPDGDICSYDFCGLAKENLSDAVYNTVRAIVDFLKFKQLYPTSNCRNADVITTLKNLKGLDLSSKNISDISPLYQMVGLEKLILDHNSIQDLIFLSRKPALKVLSVTFNRLLSLRGLDSDMALEEVYVTNNQIQQVNELATLPNLKTVDITNNQVKSVVVLTTRSNRIRLACAGNPGIITEVKASSIGTSTQSGSCFHGPTGFADFMNSSGSNLDCIWGGVQFIAYTISTTPLY